MSAFHSPSPPLWWSLRFSSRSHQKSYTHIIITNNICHTIYLSKTFTCKMSIVSTGFISIPFLNILPLPKYVGSCKYSIYLMHSDHTHTNTNKHTSMENMHKQQSSYFWSHFTEERANKTCLVVTVLVVKLYKGNDR